MKKFASALVLALMAVLMLSVFAPALAEEAAAAAPAETEATNAE